ncbi:hypothetical protein ACFU3E_11655 [Streptomyces sp. NPDC057424]|uniref:hypothetical protein n=1 Tax=Streptomyces sp. NPDC057424 TaxID=3346127 RepID=UPI00369749A3
MALLSTREGADVSLVQPPEERVDAERGRGEVAEQGRRCLLPPGDLSAPGVLPRARRTDVGGTRRAGTAW